MRTPIRLSSCRAISDGNAVEPVTPYGRSELEVLAARRVLGQACASVVGTPENTEMRNFSTNFQ